MKKIALFVFNGDPMCFIHVLLNALDFRDRGYAAAIVVEGSATQLIPALAEEGNPQHKLWKKVRSAGLVAGVCRACSQKMGTLESAREQGLVLLDEISGHPSMARFRGEGYELLSF